MAKGYYVIKEEIVLFTKSRCVIGKNWCGYKLACEIRLKRIEELVNIKKKIDVIIKSINRS